MKTTITLGPMVNAASVEGQREPIVKPRALEVSVWSASAPKNRVNFCRLGCLGRWVGGWVGGVRPLRYSK